MQLKVGRDRRPSSLQPLLLTKRVTVLKPFYEMNS